MTFYPTVGRMIDETAMTTAKDAIHPLRDRIVELRRVPAAELRAHPKNWRTHPDAQRSALRAMLEEVGIADALIAYASAAAGGALTLIDGHLRQDEAPDAVWPVLILDLTDEEAEKVLATLDPLAAMATTDVEQLQTLLDEIEASRPDVEALLAQVAEAEGAKPPGFKPVSEDLQARLDEKKMVTCPDCGREFRPTRGSS